MATIALFIALGGGAYAAATIDSSDVKDNSLQSVDVKNANLSGTDVKDDSLGGGDIIEKKLSVVDIKTRARGAQHVAVTTEDPFAYPLSGDTWTQFADETDEVFGQARISGPVCKADYGALRIQLKVAGRSLAEGYGYARDGQETVELRTQGYLFEPGHDTQRRLVAAVSLFQCAGDQVVSPAVESVKANIVSSR